MTAEETLAHWRADEQALRSRPHSGIGVAKLNIVRALTEGVPLVRAEGRVVHGGRQVATAEGRLVGPDGKLYAHATTTCLVFDQT